MTPRRIDEVQPGYYRFRLVKGGPWVPAHVTIEDGMIFVVEADERLRVAIEANAYEKLVVESVMAGEAFQHSLTRVLWFGTLIDETEYNRMLGTIAWAREHHPDHPCLHPDEPIEMKTARVPF